MNANGFNLFEKDDIKNWLSHVSIPVLVFFYCHWQENCRQMRICLDDLAEKYWADVHFVMVDGDSQGKICRQLSVARFPTVIIFSNGREEGRFFCISSIEGIDHKIAELIRRQKRRNVSAILPSFFW